MTKSEIKYFFLPLFCYFSFQSISAQPTFNIGESTTRTGFCEGTLFDSGGISGAYEADENTSLTICPAAFHRCIKINVEEYDIEKQFDFLTIYEGVNTDGQKLATINGTGWQTLTYAQSDCVTVQFTSDGSQNGEGFRLSWQCLAEDCPEIDPTTCDAPAFISQIPFQATNLTTCFAGNNIEIGPCGADDFLSGQEYIFAYDSPGGECIAVNITGLIPETGISIIKGCPENGDGACIEQKEVANGLDHIFLPNVALKEKGTYYFLLANEANCTPFNIDITTSATCPNTLPAAANCTEALILNGCSPELPAALTVERAAGDPDFFKFGVNNGCWDGIFATNYTWFTFEAQGDGEFAFLLDNNDPNGSVDVDFNIWGPFDNKEAACIATNSSQPIRSSWADNLLYSVTGLANIHPVLGTPVTSTCEDAFGEGFVKPIEVKKGEVYMVLINDFDGVIFSGAIEIDFGGSDATVLTNISENISTVQDTFICAGSSIELTTKNASAYDWSPSEGLSCSSCPNPIATPTETTTYTLNARTVCNTITEEITVNVIPFIEVAITAKDDFLCEEESTQLTADLPEAAANISWSPLENINCTDCPNPEVTPNQTTLYTLSGTLDNCLLMGAIEVATIGFSNTQIVNYGSTSIFIGQSIDSMVIESNLASIESIEWYENGQLIEGEMDSLLNHIPLAGEPISMENRTVLIAAKITTTEGCTYTAETSILVKPPLVPNVFTPNNDQKNDFFNILLANHSKNIEVFKVYNRWGKLMYDNDAPEKGWNGGLRNKLDDLMPSAVYIYVIQYRVGEQIESVKGNVTLIR